MKLFKNLLEYFFLIPEVWIHFAAGFVDDIRTAMISRLIEY